MYRVNYGNGQANSGFSSKSAAQRHIDACVAAGRDPYVGSYFIEKYIGDGDWVRA